MKLSEVFFKPKHEKLHVYEDFYLIVERLTKPEISKIWNDNVVSTGNDIQFKTKKVKTPIGSVEVSSLSVALAKKIKGWEGLTGSTLKKLLPDLEINVEDDIEIEYEEAGAILLIAYGVIPDEDKPISFEEFLLNHINSLMSNLEEEVIEIEKK